MCEFRTLKEEEVKYTLAQSSQLNAQTGAIGYAKGYFGESGMDFILDWFPLNKINDQKFQDEFYNVKGLVRIDFSLLTSRKHMKTFCYKVPAARLCELEGEQYGFCVETDNYTYLIRCNIDCSVYDFYIFCYQRKLLENHIKNANNGIRFIDSSYNEKFRIKDVQKIIITFSNGEKSAMRCRYIDENHIEIYNRIFHILQYAEIMEKNGNKIAPKTA